MSRKKTLNPPTPTPTDTSFAGLYNAINQQPVVPPGPDTRHFTHRFSKTKISYACTKDHPGAVRSDNGTWSAELHAYYCPRCGQLRPLRQGEPRPTDHEEAGICPAKLEPLGQDGESAEVQALRNQIRKDHAARIAMAALLMAIYSRAPWTAVVAEAEKVGTILDHDPSFMQALKQSMDTSNDQPF